VRPQLYPARLIGAQITVAQLYSKLSPQQQAQAFVKAPPRTRKIILSTNVAETSVTIPGIKYVIDSGLMKEKRHHSAAGIDSLLTAPISQSNAQQRAGRAGRESAGTCYRLYTESAFHTLAESQVPEIERCSLALAMLHLMAAGVQDPFRFDFLNRPPESARRPASSAYQPT
jgi:ATP-dependent RNA helicase DHX33